MRVARFHAPGDIRLVDAPEPEPGPGELKIRVRNCSACGTDVKISKFGHHHIVPPRVMGHEIAGEVVEVGTPGASSFVPGHRVQVIAAIPCGSCAECGRGRMTVCAAQESMGYHYDGGFADYMIVPAKVLAVHGVNRIPDGVSFAEASLAEPLACVLNGQHLAGVGAGDDVVVFGAGPVGCLHVRVARAGGARRVLLVDVNPERLERAAAIVKPDATIEAAADPSTDPAGDAAVERIRALTDGRGADVLITAAASARAQEQAIAAAAPGGRVSFFGGLAKNAPIISCDSNRVHYRELTLVGANGSSPAHNARALEMIGSGRVPVDDLITHRIPLERLPEALDLVARGEAIKVTVQP